MPGQRSAARVLVAVLATVLSMLMLTPAPSADAATTFGVRAVALTAAQKGKPYVWGAAGPTAFDCSGLVKYVYSTRLHKSLPRTASAQKRATTPIPKSQVRPGDLIFFYDGAPSNVYHVGVYAGGGQVWHAPKRGAVVRLNGLWTTKWTAGRVR